jgi:hypothetical protein
MKKLDNKQKLIWDHSNQAQPDFLFVGKGRQVSLVQHMEISDRETGTDQDRQEVNPPGQDIWTLVKPRLNYAIALGLALVFIVPVAYESFTTETLLTKTAEYQTAHLPDGSSVSLNSESKIRYNQDFSTNHRTLALSGEAYFDVIKGSAPFIINTEYGQVTVVGTSFNVRTREDGFEVGVNEGRVDVSSETIFPGTDIKRCPYYSNLTVFRINDKGSRSFYYVEIGFSAEGKSTMIRTEILVIPDLAF